MAAESVTEVEQNPFMIRFEGTVNGQPHSIDMDVREQLRRSAATHGVVETEADLEERSVQLRDDLLRLQAARNSTAPRRSIGFSRLVAAAFGASTTKD